MSCRRLPKRDHRGSTREAEIDERVRSVLVDRRPGVEDVGLARVTPPLSTVKSQSPGSSSLLPPMNAVSSSFASSVCLTSPAARRPCQSTSGASSSWFPSAPWNGGPGGAGSSRAATSRRAPVERKGVPLQASSRPHSRARRRREADPPKRDIEQKVAVTGRKPQTSPTSSQRRSLRTAIPAPPAMISAEAQAARTRSGIGIERASFVSTLSACSIGP